MATVKNKKAQRLVMLDSEAFQSPTTAQTQTLEVMASEIREIV
jgi:hypothetical protein